jgi:integrase/recombinase XerD
VAQSNWWFFLPIIGYSEGKTATFLPKFHDQTILEISSGTFLSTAIESFLIDRKAAGLSPHTIKFYRQFLLPFLAYCEDNVLRLIGDITADLIRRYFLSIAETHNAGGTHAAFRTLRAFFGWLSDEEIMPADWKNPITKVKAPKVLLEPLQPISLADVRSLIDTCRPGSASGDRDRAVFLVLLDTGVRAQELCDLNVEDIDLNTGVALVRYGKGGKTRTVFMGRKTRRADRSYLRHRQDHGRALFTTRFSERLTYNALRLLLDRRVKLAGPHEKPTLHGFRRAFALNMLRNGSDIFSLQRLLGHSDLQIMPRYLAQNDQNTELAHRRSSPVDNGL